VTVPVLGALEGLLLHVRLEELEDTPLAAAIGMTVSVSSSLLM